MFFPILNRSVVFINQRNHLKKHYFKLLVILKVQEFPSRVHEVDRFRCQLYFYIQGQNLILLSKSSSIAECCEATRALN